jgi:hypothetical protein
VQAQADILTHSSFVPFIDRASSIQPIDKIFSRTLQNKWKKNMEPIFPVMPLGLSSPRNMISSGSPAGEINILDLTEDRLLARHSSSLTLCAQQKA